MISAFAAQGTPVDMVSIGNEIRNGILWPVGQVDWTADTGWDNLTTLLKAGVAGARAAQPARSSPPRDAALRRRRQQRNLLTDPWVVSPSGEGWAEPSE